MDHERTDNYRTDPDIEFIGINQGQKPEKARCYFLIKLDRPYTALNRTKITHFIAYTSSGTSSQSYRIEYNIYPCFGVMVFTHHTPENLVEFELTPILLKASHYHLRYTKQALKESYDELESSNKQIFYGADFVLEHMKTYFNDENLSTTDSDAIIKSGDFSERMGSNLFLSHIVKNIGYIKTQHRLYNRILQNQVPSIDQKYNPGLIRNSLTFLNELYGKYNFYGVDFAKVKKYGESPNLSNHMIMMTNNLDCISKLKTNLKSYGIIPANVINHSPIEYDIVEAVLAQFARSTQSTHSAQSAQSTQSTHSAQSSQSSQSSENGKSSPKKRKLGGYIKIKKDYANLIGTIR